MPLVINVSSEPWHITVMTIKLMVMTHMTEQWPMTCIVLERQLQLYENEARYPEISYLTLFCNKITNEGGQGNAQ